MKSTHQNTPVCQILPFYVDKQQSYKAFHISYYDVIEALNLKINAVFEEGTSKYPMLPNFVLLPQETAKLQGGAIMGPPPYRSVFKIAHTE